MIRRYFYIFATSLFILLSPTRGIKAHPIVHWHEVLEQQENGPPGFNYQGVLRDINGQALANTGITLIISLWDESGTSLEWQEQHEVTTNDFGLFNVVVGEGTVTGIANTTTFEALDWQSSILSMQVEVDMGDGFVSMGGSPLKSVPYALSSADGLSSEQANKLENLSLDAEANVQVDWESIDTNSDAFILNKPSIPTDISDLTDIGGLLNNEFSGSYNDLTDKPTIPTDINELTDVDGLLASDFDGSFNSLVDVPDNLDLDTTDDFSGNYEDLANKPIIPTDINELTDVDELLVAGFDGAFNNLTNVPENLDLDATDDFSGSYNDLTDTPTVPTDINELTDNDGLLVASFDGSFNNLSDVPENLDLDATDDFSGSYNDLTDTPSIPTDINELTDNDELLVASFDGSFSNLTDVPENLDLDATDDFSGSYNDLSDIPTIPTDINQLTDNDGLLVTNGTGVFVEVSNTISAGNFEDDFVFGSTQLADIDQDTDDDHRVFFDKSKGAFRAGAAKYIPNDFRGSKLRTAWEDENVGEFSFAVGLGNRASGTYSSVAGGIYNHATGLNSFVGGGEINFARNEGAFVGGGAWNTVSAKHSVIVGGSNNWADSEFSTVGGGYYNYAYGVKSTIPGGQGLRTDSYVETVLGSYNVRATNASKTDFELADRLFTIGNGVDDQQRSNALVMLKNGDTEIYGTLQAEKFEVADAFELPTTDGTNGQVLMTDGSGLVSWGNTAAPGEFENNANVIAAGDEDDDFVFGATQLANDPDIAADNNRFFFDKSKGAFRTGLLSNSAADEANIGLFSFAAGKNNFASGEGSGIMGGIGSTTSGKFSFIGGGCFNKASNFGAFVGTGEGAEASGNFSFIGSGYYSYATGSHSFIGSGYYSSATGDYSFIGNSANSVASGNFSAVLNGRRLNAEAYGEVVIGLNNALATSPAATSFVTTDRIFTIGNGTSFNARSNALVVFKNGDATLSGTLTELSDVRLKQDVQPIGSTLDKVNDLEGVTYRWNDVKPHDTVSVQLGLIAQEVEKLFPEVVRTGDDGYKSVSYAHLVPVLIEAIKELSTENDQLKHDNASLEARQNQDDERFAVMERKLNLLIRAMDLQDLAMNENE